MTSLAKLEAIPTAEFYSKMGIEYESAFGHDAGLINFIRSALQHLSSNAKLLDIGCGTGNPVSSTLAAAGHQVHGIDISDKMVALSRAQVPLATFEVANMLEYAPSQKLDGLFVILSLFLLSREEMEVMVGKWMDWLEPGGMLFVCAILAEDCSTTKQEMYDADGLCARDIEVQFMGTKVLVTLFTEEGWTETLGRPGFEILETRKDLFEPPEAARSDKEMHYFITAQKPKKK